MQNTLKYIAQKYHIDLTSASPIHLNVTRSELGTLFAELRFRVGVEIGVEKGIYSEILSKANPDLKLYCIDPWKTYKGYRDHTTQSKLDGFYNETVQHLKPYRCTIIRKFSMDAIYDFADKSLDFVYIDGNHDAKHVLEDITNWSKKVRQGGIISGHDFVRFKGEYARYNQVKDTVLKYTADKNIKPWFVLKDPVERQSWMWVKVK